MLTHHAYYIEDSLERFAAYEKALRASEGFAAHDPGFLARRWEKFGIDESRELIELAALRHTGGRSLFFITAGSMTSEAQQALLKLFEEPQEGTIFVLLVPHGMLLSTLRSRMLTLPKGEEELFSSPRSSSTREFLSWPYKKRSDWVTAFLKDEEGARERVRAFLTELEAELYAKIGEGAMIRQGLQDIEHFRGYLSDRSPSLKMILEHLAATLPILK